MSAICLEAAGWVKTHPLRKNILTPTSHSSLNVKNEHTQRLFPRFCSAALCTTKRLLQ